MVSQTMSDNEATRTANILPGACALINEPHAIPLPLAEALDSLDVPAGAAGCNGCVAASMDEAFVYYVAQSEEHVERPRYIKFHADDEADKAALAGQLVHALNEAGLGVEWGGDLGTAVRVHYE